MRLLPPVLRLPLRLVPLPHALVDPLAGAAVAGADELAERLAAVVVSIPDRHLERLMRTPARRLIVEAIFLIMPRYLDRTSATGLDMAIRWRVTGPDRENDEPDVYDLIIAQRRCRVTRGESEARPLVTITIAPADLLRLATGQINPMRAYLDGHLTLRGDIMQAARLTSLFRIPAPAIE